MTNVEIKKILDTLGLDEAEGTSVLHPPLATGYWLNDPAKIIEFANKIEIAVLAKAILES